jgi:multidrug efflux pump subunit AcrB
MREGDQLIDVVARAAGDERARISALADINIHTSSGRYVPLAQLAKISYELEEPVIARRNRLPTVTVRADIRDGIQAPAATAQIDPLLDPLRARLPPGFPHRGRRRDRGIGQGREFDQGGDAADAGQRDHAADDPVAERRPHAARAADGAARPDRRRLALLIFQVPFGFVANLGVIALSGMIMRNSVILVDQIEQDEKAGKPAWEAIVGSTVRRFRPIMLTAAAAILAMIPLTRSVFWGPMAVAIMGGLIVATLLTLLFLPALYAAWYRS